ncbi:MAG: sigma-70 family RNA polymerase sigma factor [Phycisphaerales bacterium]|nr:sigma-70 family RNA polymerase sigma factor [Phycisphaerales bacterium]
MHRLTHAQFETTSWTLLADLQRSDEAGRHDALAALAERYWPPVYAYYRRSGRQHQEAADLAQAFFADVVLTRRLFDGARPGQTKLRTLILRALKNYLIDQHRREKRRPQGVSLSGDAMHVVESHFANDDVTTVEQAFDREWSAAIISRAMKRCEQHYRQSGRERQWQVFEAKFLGPILHSTVSRPYADLAAEFGFESAQTAATAAHSVKKRAMTFLHETVAETVENPADVESELALIASTLGAL